MNTQIIIELAENLSLACIDLQERCKKIENSIDTSNKRIALDTNELKALVGAICND